MRPVELGESASAGAMTIANRVIVMVLVVWGVVGLVSFGAAAHFARAWEDALMLFAYSKNLAETSVISFFPHGPATEGATDFLWMVILAAGARIGMNILYLADLLSAVAVLGMSVVLVKIAGTRPNFATVLTVVGIVFLTPQTWAAMGGFSIFPFGFVLGLLVFFLLNGRFGAASIAALFLCLLRPDGVVFALPLLVIFLPKRKGCAKPFIAASTLFILPGCLYFLWRWRYFGDLMPLPFWVKSDTPRLFGLFVVGSFYQGALPIGFAVLVIWMACGSAIRSTRNLKLLLGLLVLPSLFYFHIRLDQNIGGRFFFYPFVAIGILLAANWNRVHQRADGLLIRCLLLWGLCFGYSWITWGVQLAGEGSNHQVEIARELAKLPGKGTMITTEAGILVFYSQWTAYDAWGLNTAEFAHQIPQPSDLASLRPDLIIIHREDGSPCLTDLSWQVPYHARTWVNMERNLIVGATDLNYKLWLEKLPTLPSRSGDQDICWFVKPDSSQKDGIESILKKYAFSVVPYSGGPLHDMNMANPRSQQ